MITCKEDLINTAVFCPKGELRDLYIEKCSELGVSWEHASDINKYTFLFILDDMKLNGIMAQSDGYRNECKRLTLSDLNPRTKEVYEKVDFNSTSDAYRAMLDGDALYNHDGSSKFLFDGKNFIGIDDDGAVYSMECHSNKEPFYRKVTKPIEWYEDAIEFASMCEHVSSVIASEDAMSIKGSMTRDQWCDFARILLEQGE